MRWTTAKIRQSFLDFFAARGHTIVPSASLIPKGDPTLLFTNAGMVQFKDYFLGVRTPQHLRVADCQKCLRISGKHNDLEAVGRDTYHHTFFEMLGNWSFGDYYKEEAIRWHWELITKVWEIDPNLLYATVHNNDQEAEDIWLKMNVLPRERILRFGDKDNFWEMGETGPCGPCSEITIDRGEAACSPEKNHAGQKCFVNVDGCERFIEMGNLVFIQYNRDASGKLTPLAKKHVDTGTGLERMAAAMQSIEETSGRQAGNPRQLRHRSVPDDHSQDRRGRAEVRRQGALRPERRGRHIVSRDRRSRAHDDLPDRGGRRPRQHRSRVRAAANYPPRRAARTLSWNPSSVPGDGACGRHRGDGRRVSRDQKSGEQDRRSNHAGRIALRRDARSRARADRHRARANQREPAAIRCREKWRSSSTTLTVFRSI